MSHARPLLLALSLFLLLLSLWTAGESGRARPGAALLALSAAESSEPVLPPKSEGDLGSSGPQLDPNGLGNTDR